MRYCESMCIYVAQGATKLPEVKVDIKKRMKIARSSIVKVWFNYKVSIFSRPPTLTSVFAAPWATWMHRTSFESPRNFSIVQYLVKSIVAALLRSEVLAKNTLIYVLFQQPQASEEPQQRKTRSKKTCFFFSNYQ